MVSENKDNGYVYLVGAGPGDPGLLTLKGQAAIAKADIILYDYLVHPNCLLHASQDAELSCVGKRKGAHSKKQTEIHHSSQLISLIVILMVTYLK